MKYNILDVDAMQEEKGVWSYNAAYTVGRYTTTARDEKRAFLYQLKKLGIVCKRGRCRVEFDGEAYELQDRKTGEPLFAAVPSMAD